MTAIRNYLDKKGQGIVEYAVLLAFVVALAMMLNAGGLKDSVVAVFDDVADFLAYRTYTEYYGDWHNLSKADLYQVSNAKRLKADQEGLQALVQNLIGLSAEDALTELQKLMSGAKADDVNPNADGDSKALTLLTYWGHYDGDASTPYITLGHDTQMDAVGYITNGQATTYAQNAADNILKKDRTVSGDRIFFSNGMTGDTNQRTITAQLHYTDGKVSSVSVAAHNGNAGSAVADGLDITVTGQGWRGYSVN